MENRFTLPTIWEVPDALWHKIQSILPQEKPSGTPGRPPIPFRQVLNGILYVLRTGCQWKQVPRYFGSGSTIHARFQQWQQLGVFEKTWVLLLDRYEELSGIEQTWMSLDSATVKAPLGGNKTGPNPTDRGKLGTKRHTLVDERGVPLAVKLSGANRHDMKMALPVVDAIVYPTTSEEPRNLCLDKGYDYPEIDQGLRDRSIIGHTRRRGEAPLAEGAKRHPARRWVVERTPSWYNRCRKLLIRYEKKDENYLALIDFASALIVYRTIWRLLPDAPQKWVFG